MKKLIISFIFLFIISEAKPINDSTKLDSLFLIVNDIKASDSIKFYSYYEISKIYSLSNSKKSKEFAFSALEVSKQMNSPLAQGIALRQIGAMSLRLDEISNALAYHLQALALFKKTNNENKYAEILQEIGIDYVRLGEYNKALSFIHKARKTFRKINNIASLSTCLNNMGGVFYYLEQYDSALFYYQESVDLSLIIDDKKNLSYAYHNIGSILRINKNYTKAEEYIKKSLKLKNELGNKTMLPNTLITYGEIEIALAKYKSAFEKLTKALNISKEIESKNNIRDCYKLLVELEEKRGDNNEALKYHKELLVIEKEISDDLKNELVSKLQIEFETEEIETENKLLKEKAVIQEKLLRNQKIVNVSVIIILLMFIGLAWQFLYNLRKQKSKNFLLLKRNTIIKAQSEELTQKNIKLNELNSTKDKFFSIIGHDLRNPFNAIVNFSQILIDEFSNLSEKEKSEYISFIYNASNSAFELLNNLLEWSRTQTGNINYKPELLELDTIIKDTIDLLQAQTHNKNIDILVNGKLNVVYADLNMIRTVLRNIISNAIKYSSSGDKVIIKSKVLGGFNYISIIDSGIGIEEENIAKLFRVDVNYSTKGTANEKGTGLGLILCKEFVELNHGEIIVKSNIGKGTEFIVKLPVNIQNKIQ